MGQDNKLILIKRLPYMDRDYVSYMVSNLNAKNIASKVYFAESISMLPDSPDSGFLALILNGMVLQGIDSMIGDIITSINTAYVNIHCAPQTEGPAIFIDGKGYTMKDLEAMFLHSGSDAMPGVPITTVQANAEKDPKANLPSYVTEFDMCPNIAIEALRSFFVQTYEDLLKTIILGKNGINVAFDSNGNGNMESESVLRAVLSSIKAELEYLEQFEIDCETCEDKETC
jgi:hypothetical protein